MRGDLAGFASGVRASVHFLANTSGLSEHLPKALASFLTKYPAISVDVEERESVEIATALASGAADIGLAVDATLPEALPAVTIHRLRNGAALTVVDQPATGDGSVPEDPASGAPSFRAPQPRDRGPEYWSPEEPPPPPEDDPPADMYDEPSPSASMRGPRSAPSSPPRPTDRSAAAAASSVSRMCR